MITQPVPVSAAVGKQVVYTPSAVASAATSAHRTGPVVLKGFLLSPLSAKARVTILDGNASGELVAECAAPSGQSIPVTFPGGRRFDKGMHVLVLGASAQCYLYLD